MDLQSILTSVLGGQTQDKIASKTGASSSDITSVISASLPVILGQLGHNTQSADGAAALDKAASDHAGDTSGSVDAQDGINALSHIFNGNHSTVADNVSKKTGVDAQTVTQILGYAAPLVLAQLGKQKQSSGTSVADILGGIAGQKGSSGNTLMDIATTFLDKNHDGSAVDEIIGGISGFFGKK